MSESGSTKVKTNRPDLDLNLPDGSNYVPKRFPVDPLLIFELSEKRLPLANARPNSEERRFRDKFSEPFKL